MGAATHIARQLLWMQQDWPHVVAQATAFLAGPQYWAWRLSGVAASEVTSLGAQSGLWDVIARLPGPIVASQGWHALLPPQRPAWATLGRLRPELAARTGLDPATRIVCGVHDSSGNLYRYQAAGLADAAIVSTGTWIVALNPSASVETLNEAQGMTCNADVFGHPVPGALLMGGRAFSRIAGDAPDPRPAAAGVAAALVARGTFVVGHDALGGVVGRPPEDALAQRTLAVLHMALLTDACLTAVASGAAIVLDGSFLADPLYPSLVAALRPQQRVRVNASSDGVASGAALLAGHGSRAAPAPLALDDPAAIDLPGLSAYRARWAELATTEPRP
jgi:sugar (pentulose or hexulose) kinase